MLKRDYLLQLIASLSPNEKRYFKLFSGLQPGDKYFMQLFDELEGKDHYDLKELSTKLDLTPRQLTDAKHYLQLMLLRCLRSFEEQAADHSANYSVHINRADVQLLANRRLHDFAIELGEKTIAKSLENEMFETASQLLYIRWTGLYNSERFDEIGPTLDMYDHTLKIMAELNDLNKLRALAAIIERKRGSKNEFDKILKSPLLKKKPEKLLSLKAQISWFEIMLRCYIGGGYEPSKALEIARLQVRHYEKTPAVKNTNPLALILAYDYLANAENEAGNGQTALLTLARADDMINGPHTDIGKTTRKTLTQHAQAVRVGILYHMGRYKETLSEADKTGPYLESRPVYEQLHVMFYQAMALLHTRQSSLAIDTLNQLLQINTEHRIDLQKYMRPAMILAQLDVGNYQVVPYLVKAARAWMKTRKITDPEINSLLSGAYSIAMAAEPVRRKAWLKLKEAATPANMKALNKELDLDGWLEHKLAR